ncbi:MAG: hypothetical protein ACRDY7_17275 [Acidimicrobiia bacterium]
MVEEVDQEFVERLAARHTPNARAVEMGVDIVGDPHREDDGGHNWAVLSDARSVRLSLVLRSSWAARSAATWRKS